MDPLNPTDRDNLIKTVYGEANGQPPLGQAAIAHAILNRLSTGGYGNTITDIVKAPVPGKDGQRGYHEFTPWNDPSKQGSATMQNLSPNSSIYKSIGGIVDQVYNGQIPDPTNGATHYYGIMPHNQPPSWAGPLAAQNQVKIGDQTFVGGGSGPGQAPPGTTLNSLAGGAYDMGMMGS